MLPFVQKLHDRQFRQKVDEKVVAGHPEAGGREHGRTADAAVREEKGTYAFGIRGQGPAVSLHGDPHVEADAFKTGKRPVGGHDERHEHGAEGHEFLSPGSGEAGHAVVGAERRTGRRAGGDDKRARLDAFFADGEDEGVLRASSEGGRGARPREGGRRAAEKKIDARILALHGQPVGQERGRTQTEDLSEVAFLEGQAQFAQKLQHLFAGKEAQHGAHQGGIARDIVPFGEGAVGEVAASAAGHGELDAGTFVTVGKKNGTSSAGRVSGTEESGRTGSYDGDVVTVHGVS